MTVTRKSKSWEHETETILESGPEGRQHNWNLGQSACMRQSWGRLEKYITVHVDVLPGPKAITLSYA